MICFRSLTGHQIKRELTLIPFVSVFFSFISGDTLSHFNYNFDITLKFCSLFSVFLD